MRLLDVLVLSAFIGLGCASGTGRPAASTPDKVQGYAVEPAFVDALALERAPRVLYGGDWARLVEGRWYYPTKSGWVVFLEEPVELRRQRDTTAIEQPPTAGSMPRGPETSQASPLFATPLPH
jgi:hypothetical protein